MNLPLPNKPDEQECICTKICDCQNPEPKSGVALLSNECPVHNDNPRANPDCKADIHNNGVIRPIPK